LGVFQQSAKGHDLLPAGVGLGSVLRGMNQVGIPSIAVRDKFWDLFEEFTRAEAPMTVFRFASTDPASQVAAMFFLRTPFTISEFRREIQKPI
jgi:hypothetical protein